MPTARLASTAAIGVVRNKITVIGHHDGNPGTGRVNEEYDPATNSWATKASHPRTEGRLSLNSNAVIGDTMYLIGGANIWNNYHTQTVDTYNPVTNTWQLGVATYPIVVGNLSTVTYNGAIYCFGGDGYVKPAYKSTYRFDPAQGSFTGRANMPIGRSNAQSVVRGSEIWVLGGTDMGSIRASSDIYNPGTNSWRTGPALPLASEYLYWAGLLDDAKLYIVYAPTATQKPVIYRYRDATSDWELLSNTAAISQINFGVAAVGSRIYAIGGGDPKSSTVQIAAVGAPAANCPAWADNFQGSAIDTTKWRITNNENTPGNHTDKTPPYKSYKSVTLADHANAVAGYLQFKLIHTPNASGGYDSFGAGLDGKIACGFGTYEWRLRAPSTATTARAAGRSVTGSVGGAFNFVNNSQTEIDFEFLGTPAEQNNVQIVNWYNQTGQPLPDPIPDALRNSIRTAQKITPATPPYEGFQNYRFNWSSSEIKFRAGNGVPQSSWSHIPQKPAPVMMNLWGNNDSGWGGPITADSVANPVYIYVKWFRYLPAAPSCSFVLAAPNQVVNAGVSTQTVSVIAPAGCSWAAVSDDPWVTITGAGNGVGNGTFSVAVVPNTGAEKRSTLIRVDETSAQIEQRGSVSAGKDLNGDSYSDVLIYDPSTGSSSTGRSTGGGAFAYVGSHYTSGFDTIRLGHFNSDRRADIIVYNSTNGLGYLGLGDGAGQFNFRSLFWGDGFTNVAATDLNGDGLTDFILYRATDGTMYTARSQGDGTFLYRYTLVNSGYTNLIARDFNNDGADDLLLYRKSDGLAYLGTSTGGGYFTFAPLSLTAGYTHVESGDLNGDGKADLVLYSAQTGQASIGLSGSTMAFTSQTWTHSFTAVRLFDFDGDARDDLALYRSTDGLGYLGRNNGSGGLTFGSLFWGRGFQTVEPLDLNGDGKVDILLYNSQNAASYTGLSTGSPNDPFVYSYAYWGTNRIIVR